MAAPLTSLLEKDASFQLSSDCEYAFSQLKELLTTAPVLIHYDQKAIAELHTDASGGGIGTVFAQRVDGNPMEHAVAYGSRTLTKAEQNYATIDRECLAIVWAVENVDAIFANAILSLLLTITLLAGWHL